MHFKVESALLIIKQVVDNTLRLTNGIKLSNKVDSYSGR